MDRLVGARREGKGAARGVGKGPFAFIRIPSDPGRIAEEMVFAL
jgi:hypothetical protein